MNMKIKYCFSLAVILIILFSLATVVASENITGVASSEDVYLVSDSQISVDEDKNEGLYKSQEENTYSSSNSENVDLSVLIDVKNVQIGKKYNQPGYEVPWTITANVSGGTAYNVKILEILTDNLQILSYNLTKGTFNQKTKIWDVGDLTSSDSATLTILTKLKEGEKFRLTVNATTDSKDMDLENNWDTVFIKSGTSKFDSNVSNTDDDKNGPKHDRFRPKDSWSSGWLDLGNDEETTDRPSDGPQNPSDDPQDPYVNPNKDKNHPGEDVQNPDNPSIDENPTSPSITENNGGVLAKTTEPFTNAVLGTIESLSDLFSPVSAANSESNLSAETVKAISAQNYTRIPMLIFALFLILLVAFVGYGKVKA